MAEALAIVGAVAAWAAIHEQNTGPAMQELLLIDARACYALWPDD